MQFANSWSALMLVTLLAGGVLHSARPMALSAQDPPTTESMGPVQGATIHATARVVGPGSSDEVRALAERMMRTLSDQMTLTLADRMAHMPTDRIPHTLVPASGEARHDVSVAHEHRPWIVGWVERSPATSRLRVDVADLGH